MSEVLQRRLLDELAAAGWLRGGWRAAFEAVPRHLFVPAMAWVERDGVTVPLVRGEDPAGWLEAVYRDVAVTTQYDDGAVAPGAAAGRCSTSSCSAPSVVAMMLDEAGIEDGMRVLEIGTGSGWNAALLCARLGEGNVVTVEVDPQVAAQARAQLARAGWQPVAVVGDGGLGWAPEAPYDRVVATAAVQQVPYPWVAQCRAGGVVLTPWRSAYDNGALLRLVADGDGGASGRFVNAEVAFMALRGQRLADVEVIPADVGRQATTGLHPRQVVNDAAAFAVGVRVVGCERWVEHGETASVLRLDDTVSGSWASVTVTDEVDVFAVSQGGPRSLWSEVEDAYRWWCEVGQPGPQRFGLSVHLDRQWVWLDEPEQSVTGGH